MRRSLITVVDVLSRDAGQTCSTADTTLPAPRARSGSLLGCGLNVPGPALIGVRALHSYDVEHGVYRAVVDGGGFIGQLPAA